MQSRIMYIEYKGDGLYGSNTVAIDDDVREEYWSTIRGKPQRNDAKSTRELGKYAH